MTRYLHLDSFSVRKYDRVSRGQQIGISGNTGAPGESEGRGYHLHFDVNNVNNPTPSYSQTINPEYFWPNIFNFVITSESDDSHHSDHLHFSYDDPEYFIDQILIDYVGEDKFNEWMYNSAPEDRTLTNLKKHFNITDKKIEKLDKDAKDKATKGKK
ncbi:M23 family metallopeptidase [Brevibacillus composti]|uniref:M23 family metallopeptidase n=1 Tax=Brevibacillus composti TaxID=2796470 RepID=A0A7T5JQY6_9BACL|nr:M23 family metallopeptidase [Brevibacillus composti]QQE76665.1 M23 family metallopeptidase [Brevibacillus composti]QUO43735.1 M23 family metallopeptidase [Brevibacillus composti]